MRDPERIEPMLELLAQVWRQNPDLRLAQILVNAIPDAGPCPQVFHAEDDVVDAGLRRLLGPE